jgi:hypothetical protein
VLNIADTSTPISSLSEAKQNKKESIPEITNTMTEQKPSSSRTFFAVLYVMPIGRFFFVAVAKHAPAVS